MSRNSASFAYLNTGSPGKLRTINTQIDIINNRFNPTSLQGFCIGIPGAGLQAERHRDEYLSYGIDESRQVMVDYDPIVSQTQKSHMAPLNYKGTIVCNDLMSVAHALWNQGAKIDVIDYDDVTYLMPHHEKAIEDAAQHDVKAMILVITSRCNNLTPYLNGWKKKLGLPKRYVSKYKEWREPVRDIQIGAINQIADQNNFDVTFIPYAGRDIGPPMLSCVLTKKP